VSPFLLTSTPTSQSAGYDEALPPVHCTTQRRVSLPRRLAAIFYDILLLFALLFFASMIVVVPFGITMDHPLHSLYVVYIYVVSFIFFGWFWTHGGQTLGMRAWRVRVQRHDGRSLTWRHALVRFLAAVISCAPFGAGFIWCLFSKERLALHDILSATHLVRTD
jgi:uncharacterized RDD family membrane protein YckC